MKNIASTSVFIKDEKGNILFIINRNKIEFSENMKFENEAYYSVGSILLINKIKRTITDIQFIYRNNQADFQTVITVN